MKMPDWLWYIIAFSFLVGMAILFTEMNPCNDPGGCGRFD